MLVLALLADVFMLPALLLLHTKRNKNAGGGDSDV